MKSKIIIVIMTAVITFSLAACGGGNTGSGGSGYKKDTLTIAHQRDDVYFSLIPLVMRHNSLMEKYLPEGIAVEWKNIDVQTDMRDAIVAGVVDIGVLPSSQLIIANAAGIPLIPISDFVGVRVGLYSFHDNIKSVDDIQVTTDKIFAASFGNASHTSFQIFCYEAFGDAQKFDTNIAPMSYADMWASVESSDDLAVGLIAFSDNLKADARPDLCTLILDLSPYVLNNSLGSMALTTEDFYNNNPTFIDAYRKASKEAVDFVLNNNHEAAVLLSNYWEYDISIIENELSMLPPSFGINESGFDALADFMFFIGTLKDEPRMLSEMPNYKDIPKN